jgi:hypothetical protein
MFWNQQRKSLNSEEYDKILKKLSELDNKVEVLNGKFKALETNYDLLRGQFNRKLAGIRKEELDLAGSPDAGNTSVPVSSPEAKDLKEWVPLGIGNGRILQP